MTDNAEVNWHLKPANCAPSQVVEAVYNILSEKHPDFSNFELATLSFSYIHRNWWVTVCEKGASADQSTLEVTLNDDLNLTVAGIKWGAEEWTWFE